MNSLLENQELELQSIQMLIIVDDSSEAQEAGRIEDDDDLFIPGKTGGKRSRPASDNDKKPRKRQKVNSGEALDSPPGSPSSSKVYFYWLNR